MSSEKHCCYSYRAASLIAADARLGDLLVIQLLLHTQLVRRQLLHVHRLRRFQTSCFTTHRFTCKFTLYYSAIQYWDTQSRVFYYEFNII